MILDAQLMYSDAQALTATAASTNVVDHGSDRNLGMGVALAILIVFDVALAGTTPTLTIALQTDDNAAFSSAAQVAITASITAAAVGAKYVIMLPPDTSMERFSRLNYTLGGTSPTATVTAMMLPANFISQENTYYADAITISA